MTPLEHAFMINVDEKLSFETIATIFKTGYSRIPVYEVSKVRVNDWLVAQQYELTGRYSYCCVTLFPCCRTMSLVFFLSRT
jgi:hypothetical protein